MKPFGLSEYNYVRERLKSMGIPVDVLSIVNDLRKMAMDESINRGDIANNLTRTWLDIQQRTIGELNSFIDKLIDQAKSLPENDPQRSGIIKQITGVREFQKGICGITQDRVKAGFFPDIAKEENRSTPGKKIILYTSWEPAHKQFAFFMLCVLITRWGQLPQGDLFRVWLSQLK